MYVKKKHFPSKAFRFDESMHDYRKSNTVCDNIVPLVSGQNLETGCNLVITGHHRVVNWVCCTLSQVHTIIYEREIL